MQEEYVVIDYGSPTWRDTRESHFRSKELALKFIEDNVDRSTKFVLYQKIQIDVTIKVTVVEKTQ